MTLKTRIFRLICWLVVWTFVSVNVLYWVSLYRNSDWIDSMKYSDSPDYWDIKESYRERKIKVTEESIQEKMNKINREQHIRSPNVTQSIATSEPPSAIIVVQVHNRKHYLQHLINSLSQAKGIERSLIIFSHDLWDGEINQIIQNIDFAKSLQIFFPYAIQTHHNVFPNDSPNDCPTRIRKEDARKIGCINAEWPDTYGNYREAKLSQIKHHWWWKANRVFNELDVTKNYTGSVLFLEEDHYLAEDFLHVLLMMKDQRDLNYAGYDILGLGEYKKPPNYPYLIDRVGLSDWSNSKYNMAMSFDKNTWKKIHSCFKEFCEYDDYNWDWSLLHISTKCLKEKLRVMYMKAPRSFHIGECGVHAKGKKCDIEASFKNTKDFLYAMKVHLFPEKLVFDPYIANRDAKRTKPFGGWGDKRDVQLCLNISENYLIPQTSSDTKFSLTPLITKLFEI